MKYLNNVTGVLLGVGGTGAGGTGAGETPNRSFRSSSSLRMKIPSLPVDYWYPEIKTMSSSPIASSLSRKYIYRVNPTAIKASQSSRNWERRVLEKDKSSSKTVAEAL